MTTQFLDLEAAEDLARDAADFAKFINDPANQSNPGQPDGTVTTRLGQTYRNFASISAAIVASQFQNLFTNSVNTLTVTVASGSFAVPITGQGDLTITASGSTATLNTITGGTQGKILTLRPAVGKTITLTHSSAANRFFLGVRAQSVVLSDPDHTLMLRYDGNGWNVIGGTAMFVTPSSELSSDTTPQLGGNLDTNSHQIRRSLGNNFSAAATPTIADNGNVYNVTGTGTISALPGKALGVDIELILPAGVVLQHSANLILPGAANITCAAGDTALFIQDRVSPSVRWRCVRYQRVDGRALIASPVTVVPIGAPVNVSGATFVDFTTFDNSVYQNYTWSFLGVSLSTTRAIWTRTSSNGGSSYDAGSSDYRYERQDSSVTGGRNSVAMTRTDDSSVITGDLKLFDAGASAPTNMTWYFSSMSTENRIRAGTGIRVASSDVDAIRFQLSGTGTFSGGFIQMYGIRGGS